MKRDPTGLDPVRTPVAGTRGLVLRYGGAILAVAVAAGLRWLLHELIGQRMTFVTFHPLVAVVAMLAGGGPGVLATVLSGIILDVWIIAPDGRHNAAEAVGLGLFTTSCLVMSAMGEMLRRARRREKADLEDQVAARTIDLQRANANLQKEVEDRLRAEHTLRESERRYKTLAGSAPAGIFETDADGNCRFVNDRWCAKAGITPEAARGRGWADALHPDDRDRVFRGWYEAAREGREFVGEYRFRTSQGVVTWLSGRAVAVRDETGAVTGYIGTVVDITERRRGEQALRESEERLRLAVRAANIGLWDWDIRTDAVVYSAEWKAQLGYSDAEIRNTFDEWECRVHPDDRGQALDRVRRAMSEPDSVDEKEFRMRHKDGSWRWIYSRAEVIRDAAGRPVRMTGCHLDVTDRKQAEEAVRRSEERLRAILDTAADAIITIDWQGVIRSVNPAAERMFGYPAAEMTGRNVSMLMPSPYREEHDGYLARYHQTGAGRMIGAAREVVARKHDGTSFPVELAVSEVGHLPLFTGIVHDLTRRRELEREVVELVSLEQRRIGHDLHDSVAQELTALSLRAGDLAEALRTDPAAAPALTGQIARGLRRSQKQLRAVLHGLVPVAVDAEGLMAALSDLADRTRREGKVDCIFDCPESISVGDNLVATHLYLIAQEAVRNAVKHARPRHLRVTLAADHYLVLAVRDDGIGLPARPTDRQGLGLRIMRNRAAIIGAALTIGPADPTGTAVVCVLARKPDERKPAGEENPGADR